MVIVIYSSIFCNIYLLQFEVATGRFPYKKWNSVFDQLTQVVQGDAPQLDMADSTFSPDLVTFVNKW